MVASDTKPPTYPAGLMVVVGVEPVRRFPFTDGADAPLRFDHFLPLRQGNPVGAAEA
jgi:hypothetical protein